MQRRNGRDRRREHYAEFKIEKFLTSAIEPLQPLQPLQRFLLCHPLLRSQPLGTTDVISNASTLISRNIPVDIRHWRNTI